MIDSWSKLPDKIKYGNTFDFGDLDQCFQVHENINEVEVIGQHCLFQFYSKSNDTIFKDPNKSEFNKGWKHLDERFGAAICLPVACTPEAVKPILHFLLDGSDFKVADDYYQADYCKTSQTSERCSKSTIAVFFVTSLLLMCVISSTVYDLMTRQVESAKRNELFLAFSLNENLSNLLQTNIESANEVKSLSFIRFFAAICILFYHINLMTLWFPSNQPFDFSSSKFAQFLSSFGFVVNTFFVISGFLATRTVVRDLNKWDKLVKCFSSNNFKFSFQF